MILRFINLRSLIYYMYPVLFRNKFLDATGETDQFEMNLNSPGSSGSSGACG